METKYHLRVAESLHAVANLDSVQVLYVSSESADSCPPLQRTMLRVIQDEQNRREDEEDCKEPKSIALPEFSEWPPADWIKAGAVVVQATETAALSGDPTLMDFAFRVLSWWYLQISTQVAEVAYPCEQD